jgi:hypothetical protein
MLKPKASEVVSPKHDFDIPLKVGTKTYTVTVKVFCTNTALNAYYNTKVPYTSRAKIIAGAIFFHPRKSNKYKLSEAVFSLEDLTYPIISHELNHIVFQHFFLTTDGMFKKKSKREERFCELQEDLFALVVRECVLRRILIRLTPTHN